MENSLDNTDNILQEPFVPYGQNEDEVLRAALKRNFSERFHMMTTLMRMNTMLRKARIIHPSKEAVKEVFNK
jgi:hypothetical protein